MDWIELDDRRDRIVLGIFGNQLGEDQSVLEREMFGVYVTFGNKKADDPTQAAPEPAVAALPLREDPGKYPH